MANKSKWDGDFIRDQRGIAYANTFDRSKRFAVIAKCGHCGEGYYIPIMFTIRAGSASNAIEIAKMAPRVKRDKSDCIIDVFEISELEEFFITSINDHDAYLKGSKNNVSIEEKDRRIIDSWQKGLEYQVKTADMYDERFVLERCFAPRWVGSELVVPNRVNKKVLLNEFFRQSTIRYGLKKGVPFFALMYYLQYGKNNDLKIYLKDNVVWWYNRDGKNSFSLAENQTKFIERFGIAEDSLSSDPFSPIRIKNLRKPPKKQSQIDKFNAKWGTANPLGEKEPGSE